MQDIFRITVEWGAIGGFAKTVEEVAILSDLLPKSKEPEAEKPRQPLMSSLCKDFTGLRIGFVDPEKWAIEGRYYRYLREKRAVNLDSENLIINQKIGKAYIK